MVNSRISLLRAPNPSPMTLSGTNTYLIDCGEGEALCIDPGPDIETHRRAIVDRARALHVRIGWILLTHGHPDHAPGAAPLARHTGALVCAHERSPVAHDRVLREGDRLRVGATEWRVLDTPGHTFDHLAFYEPLEEALFTGDTVLGEGYVVIAPPNGAMRPYQKTLERLLAEFAAARTIYGGHGAPVAHPAQKLRDYIAHRQARQSEILHALGDGGLTVPEIVRAVYRSTDPVLWPVAARQVLAYLIALEEERVVRSSELERAPDAVEQAMLNPRWQTIVEPEHAATAEAELGATLTISRLRRYHLS